MQSERGDKMNKIDKKKEIDRLEYAIFEIEMKDKLDGADHSLINHYRQQIQQLKEEVDSQ